MNFPLHLQTFTLQHHFISLFVPDAETVKEAYQNGSIAFPYWSKVWPAAIGLSEFLLQHPQIIQNKRVTEAGAGLGLPSLIAAQYATSVLCTDAVPEAIEIALRSAVHNDIKNFEVDVTDWRYLRDDTKADVLLLSDVNYEPAAFDELLKMIGRFLQSGTTVIVSTPQRLMAKEFILPLLQYCTAQEEVETAYNGAKLPVTVLVLQDLDNQ